MIGSRGITDVNPLPPTNGTAQVLNTLTHTRSRYRPLGKGAERPFVPNCSGRAEPLTLIRKQYCDIINIRVLRIRGTEGGGRRRESIPCLPPENSQTFFPNLRPE